jgi:hypothetical protein
MLVGRICAGDGALTYAPLYYLRSVAPECMSLLWTAGDAALFRMQDSCLGKRSDEDPFGLTEELLQNLERVGADKNHDGIL